MARSVQGVVLSPGKSTPDMPRRFVVGDGVDVRNLGTVVGLTEATKSDYSDFLKGLGTRFVGTSATRKSEIPIFIARQRLKVLRQRWYYRHEGLSGVSPTRGTSEVLVCPLHSLTGKPVKELSFWVVFTHMTAFAFSNRFVGKNAWKKKWCRTHWNTHFARDKARIIQLMKTGFPIVLIGDYNKGNMSKYVSSQVWVHGGSDICHVSYIPGKKVKTRVIKDVHDNTNSDHDTIAVALEFKSKVVTKALVGARSLVAVPPVGEVEEAIEYPVLPDDYEQWEQEKCYADAS